MKNRIPQKVASDAVKKEEISNIEPLLPTAYSGDRDR
jgi:hypothetical protein